jgi:anti-sigma-K factor RskA
MGAMGLQTPAEWEAEAAEYALWIVPEGEIEAFEAQMIRDPDLRQDVVAWTEYFSTLTDGFSAEAPPEAVKHRVEARLFARKSRPIWRQLLPYVIGAVAGAALFWLAMTMGVLNGPPLPL